MIKRTAVLLLWTAPALAAAQLASDEVPHERTVPEKDLLVRQMEESRWHLGPVRIQSRLLLRNSGYDSNVFGASESSTGSWTGDVGLGGRGILPLGAKAYFVADAIPSYIWFSRFPGQNTVGGFYRGAIDAFFNRLSGEAAVYQSKAPELLSSETEVRVLQKVSDGSARVELAATRKVSVFASGEVQEIRNSAGENVPLELESIERLDRRESASRAGVRYRFAPNFDVSAAIEGTRTSFVVDAGSRDNKSHAYLAGIHYDQPRFFVNFSGGYRKGGLCRCTEAFPSYETGTGSYFVSFLALRKLELQGWGRRGISWSVFESGPYYMETRNGGGPSWHAGRIVTVKAFGEYGINSYPVATEVEGVGQVTRRDTSTTWGGGVSVALPKGGAFQVLAQRTRYESNIARFNRSVTRVTAGIVYDGEVPR